MKKLKVLKTILLIDVNEHEENVRVNLCVVLYVFDVIWGSTQNEDYDRNRYNG